MWKKHLKKLQDPESYVSITLGFLVVIVAGLMIFNFLSGNRNVSEETKGETAVNEKTENSENVSLPTKHKVTTGETLWKIAEKYYGSGYNWVTIVKENKLADASIIEIGQELNIPKADMIKPEGAKTGDVSVKAVETVKNYTVQKGDFLWNIALKNYGDGYAWVKIANANHLSNPSMIHPGNTLVIPQ